MVSNSEFSRGWLPIVLETGQLHAVTHNYNYIEVINYVMICWGKRTETDFKHLLILKEHLFVT